VRSKVTISGLFQKGVVLAEHAWWGLFQKGVVSLVGVFIIPFKINLPVIGYLFK
jgi:hypothetical protein